MKTSLRLLPALAFVLTLASGASAADHPHDSSVTGTIEKAPAKPTAEQTAWLAAAQAAYPINTCVVSSDELEGGDMGPPMDYIYKVKGQPDRLVRFCCKDCVRDFKKDPAKYLAKMDSGAADNTIEPKTHSHH